MFRYMRDQSPTSAGTAGVSAGHRHPVTATKAPRARLLRAKKPRPTETQGVSRRPLTTIRAVTASSALQHPQQR